MVDNCPPSPDLGVKQMLLEMTFYYCSPLHDFRPSDVSAELIAIKLLYYLLKK